MTAAMREFLDELSIEGAEEHVRWLADHVGERIGGTASAERAAEYIRERMTAYGMDTDMQRFQAYNSHPGNSSLTVLEPEQRVIDSFVQGHSASTSPAGIAGRLVHVGPGGEEDYDHVDVTGAIVLAELSYAPPRPEKVRIAASRGAKGMVLMNWGTSEHSILPRGAVKSEWGNPTTEGFHKIPNLPVVGVGRSDGEYLKALVSQGETRVRLVAEATRQWDELVQPTGVIRGTDESAGFVLVAGHYEAWGGGTTCNATGNAVMLELARALCAHKDRLRRSVVFAFWDGHEIAEAAGSTWFVDTQWAELNERCVAQLNIDSPGMKGTVQFRVLATPELLSFAQQTAREVLREECLHGVLRGKHSDQSFYGAGISSLIGRTVFPSSEIERTNGATLGWWYHSEEDTLDKVDFERLQASMRANAAFIWRLAVEPVLPMQFTHSGELILEEINRLAESPGGRRLRLSAQLKAPAERFVAAARRLDRMVSEAAGDAGGVRPDADEVNRCLMRLGRVLLPVTHTVTGKYGQDPYGFSQLNSPLPGLAPVLKVGGADEQALEQRLLSTELLRQLNRVQDALVWATALIELTEKTCSCHRR